MFNVVTMVNVMKLQATVFVTGATQELIVTFLTCVVMSNVKMEVIVKLEYVIVQIASLVQIVKFKIYAVILPAV